MTDKIQKSDIEIALKNERWRNALATSQGRAVFWDILEWCGMYQVHQTQKSFHNGKRHIGNLLLQQLFTTDPKAYIVMQEEYLRREKEKQAREDAEFEESKKTYSSDEQHDLSD